MIDKRELILAQLFLLLKPLAPTVTRNRAALDITATELPAIMLLDSDENSAVLFDPLRDVQRPVRGTPVDLMRMMPELYIQLKPELPHNEAVGTALNTLRGKIIHAVLFDAPLAELLGSNGSISYLGCETDLGRDRDMSGRMRVNIAIMYVLRPADLAS